MRRRLFTLLSAASLALCVATIVLWVRNRGFAELFGVRHDGWPEASLYRGRAASVTAVDGLFCFALAGWERDFRTVPDHAPDFRTPMDAAKYRGRHPGAFRFVRQRNPLGPLYAVPSNWHGFDVHVNATPSPTGGTSEYYLTLPAWLVAGLLGLPPALWVRRRVVGRRRVRLGHCPACGYDLRATPERCPECGAAVGAGVPN